MDLKEKARRCQDFLEALDEERRKILVFQRELPLCLHLIDQTIESYKRMVDVVALSDNEPVLKEFISLRPSSVASDENNIQHERTEMEQDWISNLRKQEKDLAPKTDVPQKPIAVKAIKSWSDDVCKYGKEKEIAAAPLETVACSSAETTSAGEGEENGTCSDGEDKKEKSQQRQKVRRCWSEELHKRFLDAIQQLGGSHVATPKQICDLMKVDGLTNDEVKSHLQKFRLHSRRTSPAVQNSIVGDPQSPQFVVGIWIPPPDYATAAAAAAAHMSEVSQARSTSTNARYAPVPSLPSKLLLQEENYQLRDKHIDHDGLTHS